MVEFLNNNKRKDKWQAEDKNIHKNLKIQQYN